MLVSTSRSQNVKRIISINVRRYQGERADFRHYVLVATLALLLAFAEFYLDILLRRRGLEVGLSLLLVPIIFGAWFGTAWTGIAVTAFVTAGADYLRIGTTVASAGPVALPGYGLYALFFSGLFASVMVAALRQSRLTVARLGRERGAIEDQLVRIAASVPGVLSTWQQTPDGAGTLSYASPAFEDFYGLKAAEPSAALAPLLANIQPDDRARVRNELADSAGSLTPSHVEYRYLHPTKGMRWFEFWGVPSRDAHGVVQWHGYTADITDRKSAEAQNLASRERFELAMRGANDGVWDWNVASGEVYCSPRWRSMVGIGPDEPIDMDRVREAVHPEDAPRMVALIAKSGDPGIANIEIQLRARHTDGHYVDILFRALLVYGQDGALTRVVGTSRDITERKRAIVQVRQAAEVFANIGEGVVITNGVGEVQAVNPAFCRITGYAEPEVLGKNMRFLQSGRQDAAFYREMWASLLREGHWQGEVWNRRKSGEAYPELLTISAIRDANGHVLNYIGAFSDISRAKESAEKLELLAHYDPLTGLPNRLLFVSNVNHAVARARRDKTVGAVLFIDLDRFKYVNDSLGHPLGDELLRQASLRFRERLRDADILARLGGDEFVVLLEELADHEDAARVALSLIKQCEAPFLLSGGREASVGASIGITLFPDDGGEATHLLKNADAALYQAKDAGRGVYRFFTAALTSAAFARLDIEARLRHALERHEFVVYYQPLVSVADGHIKGVEALVRWQDPERGLVPPGKFIPVAESTGLIVPLGEWVLRESCRQMKRWLEAGIRMDRLAVNLSPNQFKMPDICNRVSVALEESGLSPDHLELEITEGAIMEETEEARSKMAILTGMGIRLAIDDFGTGYSSLAYLKRLPIGKLKVDQSFVRGIPADEADANLASAIIGLAKMFKLEALAEGVETVAQADFLRGQGLDTFQGYLFSRPVPATEIEALVADRAAGRAAGD